MQCQNKLKQLATAAHTYYDSHNHLPWNGDSGRPDQEEDWRAGRFLDGTTVHTGLGSSNAARLNGTGEVFHGMQFVSIWVFLLPFVEQTSLYELFSEDFQTTVRGNNGDDPGAGVYLWGAVDKYNEVARLSDVGFLACPSDGNANKILSVPAFGSGGVGAAGCNEDGLSHRSSSYVASAGDWCIKNENNDSGKSAQGYTGWTRGPIWSEAYTTFETITDGTSNTALFTERCAGSSAGSASLDSPPYRNALILSAAVIGSKSSTAQCDVRPDGTAPSTGIFNPSALLTLVDGNRVLSGQTTWNAQGSRWYNAGARFTWANFILGPNAPSGGWTANDAVEPTIMPPTSNHAGGANVAVCDATVRFISDVVDTGTIDGGTDESAANPAKNHRNGASTHGVWGAFGSANGGETVSNP